MFSINRYCSISPFGFWMYNSLFRNAPWRAILVPRWKFECLHFFSILTSGIYHIEPFIGRQKQLKTKCHGMSNAEIKFHPIWNRGDTVNIWSNIWGTFEYAEDALGIIRAKHCRKTILNLQDISAQWQLFQHYGCSVLWLKSLSLSGSLVWSGSQWSKGCRPFVLFSSIVLIHWVMVAQRAKAG